MKPKAFSILFVMATVAALALAACAQPAPTPAPAAPAATTAPAAPAASTALTTTSAMTTTAPAASSGGTPSAYKVGFENHLTGDGAVYGQSLMKGTQLAVDDINASGGINGVPLQVIYEDDRMSAADAQTAFLKLVQSDKVPVVMGSASSSVSLSICPKANEMHIVQISSVSTAEALRQCGKYFFSVMASDSEQGAEWVAVAKSLNVTQAAVMYINNDYGIGVKDTFVKAFQAAGGTILIAQPFEEGNKDFRTEVLKVKTTNAKYVFIVDHVAEGSLVIRQAKELGFTPQWVVDVSMETPEVIQQAGADAAEGAIGLSAGSTQTPQYKAFHDEFVKKFNVEPTIWSNFAYDTTMLVAKAIAKGGYTADGIQQALFDVSNDYVGASGAKKFDAQGFSQGSFDWMTVKNGQWVLYPH